MRMTGARNGAGRCVRMCWRYDMTARKTTSKTKATPAAARKAAEAKLYADIKAFGSRSKTLRREAQDLMYQCVFHALEYGNATPALKLSQEMGEAWHQKAIIRWFEDFGMLKYEKNDKGDKVFTAKSEAFKEKAAEYRKDRKAFGTALKKSPDFWDHTKNPDYKGFDLIKVLNGAVKTGSNTLKDGDKMGSGKVKNLSPENIAKLKAFIETLDADDDDAEGTPPPPAETVEQSEMTVH